MLQLCSYETVALGYSAFCDLFSQEDFLNYEYAEPSSPSINQHVLIELVLDTISIWYVDCLSTQAHMSPTGMHAGRILTAVQVLLLQ